ncbi:hypothetical protein [Hyphomicrobium sp. 2TAF46]
MPTLSRAFSDQAVMLREKAAAVAEREGGLAHGQHYLIAAEAI